MKYLVHFEKSQLRIIAAPCAVCMFLFHADSQQPQQQTAPHESSASPSDSYPTSQLLDQRTNLDAPPPDYAAGKSYYMQRWISFFSQLSVSVGQ